MVSSCPIYEEGTKQKVIKMGGEDKEKNITQASGSSDHVKEVFDTSMSRLLQDFSSAELFSNTSEVPKGANYCPESDCETVVSSMKHLHLRRPVFPKQKKTRMYTIKKKNSPNTLNLAVAACGLNRPIVWPARLSCHTEKCHSNVLRPSRLPIKKKVTCDQVTKSSLSTCSLSLEKSPQREDSVVFGKASALDFSSLSFSRLSEQAEKNVKGVNNLQEKDSSSTPAFQASSLGPAKSVCKRKSACSVPAVKFARTLVEERDSGASKAVYLDYRKSGASYSYNSDSCNSETRMTRTSTVTAPTDQAAIYAPSSLVSQPTPSSTMTSCDQSVSLGSTENLSCPSPQEISQDEANVNEMASYFEDLLHIPRKMSTMAEMMYA